MKLMIILSVFACSYAAKLDRTYLPPANAATAGGAPGSITAPGSISTPAGQLTFGEAVEQQTAQPGSGFQSSKSEFESVPKYQSSRSRQFGQSERSEPGAGSSIFSQTPSGFSGNQGPQESNAYSEQYQPERAQASADRNAETLRYENQNDGDTFAYSFETSNGISAEESGVATNGVQAQGGFSYTGDDGQQYRVTYTADENGYQPQGEHLPTPHPIPEEILRSIEENARAAAAGTQEGAYQPEQESEFESQQYSKSAVPSYQGQNQQSGQPGFGSYQSGQGQRSQYGAPESTKTFAQQDNQYLVGSNQGPTKNLPNVPRFSSGKAIDQGPSPSTPTEVNVGLGPSEPRQLVQNQGQFGISAPVIAGPIRQGQISNQGQSGYEYNRPQTTSQFSQNTQKSEQFRPQQTGSRSLDTVGAQSQGPANSITQYKLTGGSVGPDVQGSSKQNFRTPQGSDGVNVPAFGLSNTVSTLTDSIQGSSFPRPNVAQSYSPISPSDTPLNLQGSIIRRPSSASTDQGYVYGPGAGPTGAVTAKNSGVFNGQEFGPIDSSRPALQGSFGSIDQIPTKVGSTPNAFGPQGSTPSKPASQTSLFSSPDNPIVGSLGPSASNGQRPFGTNNQYQTGQDSASSQPSRPIFTTSGEPAVGPKGATSSGSQRSFGAAPQYQQSQPSTLAKPQGTSFNKPVESSNSQGSSMPQTAPYQYNRPESQGPQFQNRQNQLGSTGPRTATSGSGNIFGAPRQPPSFSPEEGYKY